MDTRNYKLRGASCRIAQTIALPLHMRSRVRELKDVKTSPERRGQGDATALIHKVCLEADMLGITLLIMVRDFNEGPLGIEKLVDWYSKTFGFQQIQEKPVVLMARPPGSTPRMLKMLPVAEAIAARAIHNAAKV